MNKFHVFRMSVVILSTLPPIIPPTLCLFFVFQCILSVLYDNELNPLLENSTNSISVKCSSVSDSKLTSEHCREC